MITVIQISYMVAAVLFIYGLKMMSKASTAVRGNQVSAVGMLIAIIATLVDKNVVSYEWIALGLAIGTVIGFVSAARIPMTSMPGFVAFFNGAGGLASLIVGWVEYHQQFGTYSVDYVGKIQPLIGTYLAVLIGGVTFTGSMIAYAKLEEKMNSKPLLFSGQQIVNGILLLTVVIGGALFILFPDTPAVYFLFLLIVAISLVLGVMVTIPIGGADMPVVISLLNSYSGMAGCAAGFVLGNTVLIVSGSLVGASGLILTNIMCKAMNRSLANVLFSGFGSSSGAMGSATGAQGEVKALSTEDAFFVLESARSVMFVPGYGMAVSQAQHVVRELAALLEKRGAEVQFAIHPVAGRMPGHMNVLLAEANVPYDQLREMDDVNPTIETVDVVIVIGANDVVNPAAREEKGSPIYGMPIINVDLAKTCFVLKRSMASGFAGIENPLFFKENTRMLFGDAKATITALVNEFKGTE